MFTRRSASRAARADAAGTPTATARMSGRLRDSSAGKNDCPVNGMAASGIRSTKNSPKPMTIPAAAATADSTAAITEVCLGVAPTSRIAANRWNLPEGWVISKYPAHAALVSEADFIAAQDTTAPRGPAGPAVRRYLLAGLITCGRCGRRLESAWSYGRAAYRCRHGYTSATVPDPARPKNAYVREDQILQHLAALAILLAGPAGTPARRSRSRAKLTGPADTAALIDQLRADGTVLTYDPDGRTLRAGGHCAPSVTIGMHAAGTHSRQDRERRTA